MCFGYKEKVSSDEKLLLELNNQKENQQQQQKLQSRDDGHAKSWKVIAITG